MCVLCVPPTTISRNLNTDELDCNKEFLVAWPMGVMVFLAAFIAYSPLDILFLQ